MAVAIAEPPTKMRLGIGLAGSSDAGDADAGHRKRPRLAATAISAAIAAWLGLSAPAVAAACRIWQLPAKFNAIEDSDFFVVFELKKTRDPAYSGIVRYTDWKTSRDVKGRATATLVGAKLDITAAWTTTSTGGGHYTYYKATISNGSISGLRTDPSLRSGDKNREVFWKSKQKATCAVTAEEVVDRTRDRVLAERNRRVEQAVRPSAAWRPGWRPNRP